VRLLSAAGHSRRGSTRETYSFSICRKSEYRVVVLVRGAGSGDEIRLFLQYHNCRCVGEPGDLQESFIWAVRAYGHRFFKRESALALPLAASDAVRGRYVRPPLGLLDRQEPRCTDGVSVCTTVNGFRSAAEVAVALLSPNFERGKSAPSGSAMEWLLDEGESENDEWCRGRHATRSQ
jgi:hypothetical protein